MSRLIITALVLGASLGIARADVYRWVDEHGEPHYTDEWVPGATVIKTEHHSTNSSTSAASQKSLAAAGARIDAQAAAENNARAVQQDVSRAREAQCKAAKDRYLKAIEARRVYKDAKDGTREYLSDVEADAYRETARKDVQENCGSVPTFDPNAPIPEPQPIEPKPIPEPQVNPADATSP